MRSACNDRRLPSLAELVSPLTVVLIRLPFEIATVSLPAGIAFPLFLT